MGSFNTSFYDRSLDIPPVISQTEREFLQLAYDRFDFAASSTSELRKQALEDHRFKIGDQWEAAVSKTRRDDSRPVLVLNRLRQFCRHITNEQRQMRPAIQINPVGDETDIETAHVIQGLCRHVEQQSDAEIAYDHAFESMVTGGFGYWRIVTDYPDDDAEEQEIYIKRILNPFLVYFDPRAKEPDFSDAIFAFIVDDMPVEQYRAEYPGSALISALEYSSDGGGRPDWVSHEAIRVAEYFYVELEDRKGQRRPSRKVKWAKINGAEVLEQPRDFPSRYIPVVPVLGDETVVDGKRDLVGIVRDARDPQRAYNFYISAAAEMIALAPKSPFLVAEGQIEGHEEEWAQANRRNFSTLTYKPVSSATGQPLGPPQRNTAEPPIQAMAMMVRQADNDLKAVTGIFDASLGQQGPEQSGRAVLLRQQQSNIANLNFTDNQARAIRFTGRILLDMFPRVYKSTQIKRIIQPDGEVQQVGVINSQESDDTAEDAQEQLAMQRVYDIGSGRYDVTVTVGPTYESKRKESVASQVALISAYPNIMPIAGDLLVRNMDWPGAQEIANRLKRMLPQQLQELSGDPNQQMQQLQARCAQQQQALQAMGQALQQSQDMIRSKLVESQSRENIALIDQYTKLAVARINASKDADTAAADREQEMLMTMMGQAHEHGIQAADATHAQIAQQQQQPGAPPQPAAPGIGTPPAGAQGASPLPGPPGTP